MRDELAGVEDPRKLVPGDPARVWEMAGIFGGLGVALDSIGLGLRTIDDGGWRGAAADSFHACFDRQPGRFLRAADAFADAAIALDSYASALSWGQRQAAEAIALSRESERPGTRVLSVAQQVELTGVVVASDDLPPVCGGRTAPHLAAADTLRRARSQVGRIGRDAAVKIRAAGELAPQGSLFAAVAAPVAPARKVPGRPVVLATVRPDIVSSSVESSGVVLKERLDHDTLRDQPAAWAAGVGELRKYLRLGLDQLSPRLRQHLFEGHVKKRRRGDGYREVGYHHREGGVDRGAVRVVRIVADPDGDGVYRARVTGQQVDRRAEIRTCTFFPDTWSQDDVLRAVRAAFLRRTFFDIDDPGARRRWRGRGGGLLIEGYVESQFIEPSVNAASARLYHIVTAYPIYQGGDGHGQGD